VSETDPPLDADLLEHAYRLGAFPMARGADDPGVDWYAPDPRAVIPLEPGGFRVRRSLRRAVRHASFEVRTDTAFEAVIRACAEPRPGACEGGDGTWISEPLLRAYVELAARGHAHSVEAWVGDTLAGGLYGVSVGRAFCGESMFSRVPFASQVCLVHLVERLRRGGYTLLDVQFVNEHLTQFGVVEIPRADYERRLTAALAGAGRWAG